MERKGTISPTVLNSKCKKSNIGVQNLNISNCEEGHGLFSSKRDKGLAIVQDKEKEEKEECILQELHLYIDTCASYVSTPYYEHLGNTEVQ